jgi:hypothetical protein
MTFVSMLKKKGLATTLEFLAVVIALFVAFNVFFPGSLYRSNWDDAYSVLLSKDMLASLVATDDLYSYMSDAAMMQSFFDNMFPVSNYVFWYNMEGIKERINVACNCTDEQMAKLGSWSTGLRMNDRNINMFFCRADLEDPESSCMEDSDLLVIWGNKGLNEQALSNYLVDDKGILEIVDFSIAEPPDAVQQNIFGIGSGGSYDGIENEIPKPSQTNQVTYEPYKLFYHMPLALYATDAASLPECGTSMRGTLNLSMTHSFWTCNATHVLFDTTGDGNPDDGPLVEGNFTTIEGSGFNVSYIDSINKIRISFSDLTPYKFDDFVQPAGGGQPVVPNDGDENRILLQMDGTASPIACGVVMNDMYDSRTAWVADFGRNGLEMPNVGDDHKQLVLSLILSVSNKETGSGDLPDIQRGHVTSYVEANNIDVFEVSKYEVGVGSPY